jgi:hypothetical protein
MAVPRERPRDVHAYIVECSSCQQPWEVPTHLLTTPEQKIRVPGHPMLSHETSRPEAKPCAGAIFPGIGMGERGLWERAWPLTHGVRSLPLVFDGVDEVWVEGDR